MPEMEKNYNPLNDTKLLDDINKAFIKKFKTDKFHYIYDVNTNEFLKVDEIVWNLFPLDFKGKKSDISVLLNKYSISEVKNSLLEIRNGMNNDRLFSSNVPEIKYTATPEEVKDHIDGKNEHTCLNVTEKCNLRCKYCVYSGIYKGIRTHSDKNMTWEIAKAAIDNFLINSRYVDTPSFNFYGGEPLLNMEIIKESIKYLSRKGKKCRYQLTTNGTLLNKSNINDLVNYNISISVSLDGSKIIHDNYRIKKDGSGSYNDIFRNLDYLKSHFPEYFEQNVTFVCVLTPPYSYKEVIDYYASDYFTNSNIAFSSVDLKGTDYFSNIFSDDILYNNKNDQLKFLKTEYVKLFCESDIFYKKLYLMHLIIGGDLLTFYKRDMHFLDSFIIVQGPCLLGQRRIFVNTDGSYYPCERIRNSLKIGSIDNGLDYFTIHRYLSDFSDLYSTLCKSCVFIRLCKKCFKEHLNGVFFEKNEMYQICKNNYNQLMHMFHLYLEILEQNPNSLNKLKGISVK